MSFQDWGSVKPARYTHLYELTSADVRAWTGSSVRVIGRYAGSLFHVKYTRTNYVQVLLTTDTVMFPPMNRVVSFNAATNNVQIEYNGARLTILTPLLGNLNRFRPSTMWQFLGELELDASGSLRLQARIARDVSGIAPDLYDQCLRIRRRFEAEVLN